VSTRTRDLKAVNFHFVSSLRIVVLIVVVVVVVTLGERDGRDTEGRGQTITPIGGYKNA